MGDSFQAHNYDANLMIISDYIVYLLINNQLFINKITIVINKVTYLLAFIITFDFIPKNNTTIIKSLTKKIDLWGNHFVTIYVIRIGRK